MLAQQCQIRGLLDMAGMPTPLRQDRIAFLKAQEEELPDDLRRERAGGGHLALATDADVKEIYLETPPVFYIEGAWAIKNTMLVSTKIFLSLSVLIPLFLA